MVILWAHAAHQYCIEPAVRWPDPELVIALQDMLTYTDRIRILEERLHLISPKPGQEIGEAPADKAKS